MILRKCNLKKLNCPITDSVAFPCLSEALIFRLFRNNYYYLKNYIIIILYSILSFEQPAVYYKHTVFVILLIVEWKWMLQLSHPVIGYHVCRPHFVFDYYVMIILRTKKEIHLFRYSVGKWIRAVLFFSLIPILSHPIVSSWLKRNHEQYLPS